MRSHTPQAAARLFAVAILTGATLGLACDDVCQPAETCKVAVDCPGNGRLCHEGTCRNTCTLGADECACVAAPGVLPEGLGLCP